MASKKFQEFLKKYNAKEYNWLVCQIYTEKIWELADKYIKGGKLLDIGCGSKPFKEFFSTRVDEHIGFDHEGCLHNQSNIDVFGDVYNMPFHEGEFDSAISTAVLEHLEEPQQAINETFRVLKKDGIAIFLAPFIWHLHEEPRDFFRYSEYGLKYLFEKAGFEILESLPLSGFWVTFGQLLCYIQYENKFLNKTKLLSPLLYLTQKIALKLDKKHKHSRWTWAIIIVAKKI